MFWYCSRFLSSHRCFHALELIAGSSNGLHGSCLAVLLQTEKVAGWLSFTVQRQIKWVLFWVVKISYMFITLCILWFTSSDLQPGSLYVASHDTFLTNVLDHAETTVCCKSIMSIQRYCLWAFNQMPLSQLYTFQGCFFALPVIRLPRQRDQVRSLQWLDFSFSLYHFRFGSSHCQIQTPCPSDFSPDSTFCCVSYPMAPSNTAAEADASRPSSLRVP